MYEYVAAHEYMYGHYVTTYIVIHLAALRLPIDLRLPIAGMRAVLVGSGR